MAKCAFERFVADGFLQIGNRADNRAMLAVGDGNYLHRNGPRLRVALELVEYAPAVHDRQLQIERDGAGQIMLRHRKPDIAGRGDKRLESILARGVEQNAREIFVIFN